MKVSINLLPALLLRIFKEKIDYNKVIFSSSRNTDYDYNARFLFEYMLQNHKNIKCRYVINNDEKRARLEEKYGRVFIETKSMKGILEALTAGAWVTSAGLPVYLPFAGRKRLIINLWHGMSLKGIALMTHEVSAIKRPFYKLVFSRNYTAISSTSPAFQSAMARCFEVDKNKVICLGQPRNDQLWNVNDKHKLAKELFGLDLSEGTKLVLYAPTWRYDEPTRFFPFDDFKPQELQTALKAEDVYIIIKYHKNETGTFQEKNMSNVKIIDNSLVTDIMPIINIFDALISDYSGISTDYLILERPIVFLPYDKQSFDQKRGFKIDYDSYTPGPKPDTMNEFSSELFRLLKDPNYYHDERVRINKKLNSITRDSCSLHAEYIIEGLSRLKV